MLFCEKLACVLDGKKAQSIAIARGVNQMPAVTRMLPEYAGFHPAGSKWMTVSGLDDELAQSAAAKKSAPGGAFIRLPNGWGQTLRFGMICFLRDMMPGSTTVSPAASAPKDLAATVLTRSFGTSRVASSFRMSTTNSST